MPTEQDTEHIFLHSQTITVASTTLSDAVVNADIDEGSVDEPEVLINEPCIGIWDTSLGRQWFVRICI